MNPSDWQQAPVKSFHDIDYFHRLKRGPVSLKRVWLSQLTGTLYTDYAEYRPALGIVEKHNWQQFYKHLKKARPERRPRYLGYFHPDQLHPDLGLRQYGSDYLIDGGNNRLVTWRFAGLESIMVEVQEYVMDYELRAAWQALTAQGIHITRLDEHLLDPQGFWQLQVGGMTVTCMGREHVLAFAREYANLTLQGSTWLWSRLNYKRHLSRASELSALAWKAGVTEHIPWYQRDYPAYLRAFKMQQQLASTE